MPAASFCHMMSLKKALPQRGSASSKGASKAFLKNPMLAAANMASAKCCTRAARFQEAQANIARRGTVNANDM